MVIKPEGKNIQESESGVFWQGLQAGCLRRSAKLFHAEVGVAETIPFS